MAAFNGLIESSDTLEALLEHDFRLVINDVEYYVKSPAQERLSAEEVTRLSDVRNLVNQLYEALNVREHQIKKERELRAQLEKLATELQPLEDKRQSLEVETVRKTSALTWIGLGLMGVQFGVLARLTWWEYSWDIMEPVTYFVTYGTAMAAYAYFVLTKQVRVYDTLYCFSGPMGVLARLTWWEYSWDIMEPVTYFVTYGTAMAAYAYFVLTKQMIVE
ncbi:mitochondrial calcium uniporter domain-containing protein [Phthorimaea operculella]|nr:mitochondrial calcium uniporter domain-containing protein [Phthorimaea operculella]